MFDFHDLHMISSHRRRLHPRLAEAGYNNQDVLLGTPCISFVALVYSPINNPHWYMHCTAPVVVFSPTVHATMKFWPTSTTVTSWISIIKKVVLFIVAVLSRFGNEYTSYLSRSQIYIEREIISIFLCPNDFIKKNIPQII